jgi:hypothetical protein
MVLPHLSMVLLTLTEMSLSILKTLVQKTDQILPYVKLIKAKIMSFLIYSRILNSIMSRKMHLLEFQLQQELNWITVEISLAQVY